MVFSLFHDQAAIERGFSVNKNCCSVNMIEDTIVAQRIICDTMSGQNCFQLPLHKKW